MHQMCTQMNPRPLDRCRRQPHSPWHQRTPTACVPIVLWYQHKAARRTCMLCLPSAAMISCKKSLPAFGYFFPHRRGTEQTSPQREKDSRPKSLRQAKRADTPSKLAWGYPKRARTAEKREQTRINPSRSHPTDAMQQRECCR